MLELSGLNAKSTCSQRAETFLPGFKIIVFVALNYRQPRQSWVRCTGQRAPLKWKTMTKKNDFVAGPEVPEYFWIPVDKDTPHGVPLILKGSGGVPICSIYDGDKYFTEWAPTPKTRPS